MAPESKPRNHTPRTSGQMGPNQGACADSPSLDVCVRPRLLVLVLVLVRVSPFALASRASAKSMPNVGTMAFPTDRTGAGSELVGAGRSWVGAGSELVGAESELGRSWVGASVRCVVRRVFAGGGTVALLAPADLCNCARCFCLEPGARPGSQKPGSQTLPTRPPPNTAHPSTATPEPCLPTRHSPTGGRTL
eukprot:scaffold2409_cov121-Isochrysis_galbana.AAC.11